MIENKEAMIELRKQGLTYKAIGEHFGISKQRAEQIIGNERVRKGSVDLGAIKYKGIYQMFVNDHKMTYRKFAKITLGRYGYRDEIERIERLILGRKSRVLLEEIDRLREYTGMTYEELFEERYNDQIQKP